MVNHIRHPEKHHRQDQVSPPRPDWIRVRVPAEHSTAWQSTYNVIKIHRLTTVCEEAACPNIHDCWQKNHATFMLMGDICTRACGFCYVATGKPEGLNPFEPAMIAKATADMKLAHVVITSVDRDDLDDGGAEHFHRVIVAVRHKNPNTTIEILTPDFRGKAGAMATIMQNSPDVFNHNMETVPRLYRTLRPGSRYDTSLALLADAKKHNPLVFTKTGIMVGLGEERQEILQVMDDARSADIDFLTIGQYLQPTKKHQAVARYYPPDEFAELATIARSKGFLMVSASPLTRSSYHAREDFEKLQAARRSRHD